MNRFHFMRLTEETRIELLSHNHLGNVLVSWRCLFPVAIYKGIDKARGGNQLWEKDGGEAKKRDPQDEKKAWITSFWSQHVKLPTYSVAVAISFRQVSKGFCRYESAYIGRCSLLLRHFL